MKRGRKPFKAKDHIVELNKFRINLAGNTLTEDQFRNELRRCGVLCNNDFWSVLKHSGLIRYRNGRFSFSAPQKPIHYTTLQEVYTIYISQRRNYLQKRRNKELTDIKEIQNAIKLLKEYNFEVIFPSVNIFYTKL